MKSWIETLNVLVKINQIPSSGNLTGYMCSIFKLFYFFILFFQNYLWFIFLLTSINSHLHPSFLYHAKHFSLRRKSKASYYEDHLGLLFLMHQSWFSCWEQSMDCHLHLGNQYTTFHMNEDLFVVLVDQLHQI